MKNVKNAFFLKKDQKPTKHFYIYDFRRLLTYSLWL